MSLTSLLDTVHYLPDDMRQVVRDAYAYAEAAHQGAQRKSGEPYFTHCEAVAQILASLRLDGEVIAAALLHDVVEDTDVTIDALRGHFGEAVSRLVDGVTKLNMLPTDVEHTGDQRKRDAKLETLRKILLTLGDDVRVVLIKLADRLHNMRTMEAMPPDKQAAKARETLEVFAPLANRLGIWQMKWELEDLSFRYLVPESYRSIARSLDERRRDREVYLANVTDVLRAELAKEGVTHPIITGRPKHLYSIYRKMLRKEVSFDEVYDVRAVRVIVDTIPQCYLVLGVVHNMWRPIPQEFDDYIASPKDNFYRSLHTAVVDNRGKTLEVQIRTMEMHEHAEYGVAAHWLYKEGGRRDDDFERRISFMRRVMDFGPEVSADAEKLLELFKREVIEDRLLTFTPKGEPVDLPKGATPLDFAYSIHTEIGHSCVGAKVHGRMVPLDYVLQMGDKVEIMTGRRNGPSHDWLNPDLNYVKTHRARSKIAQWFRKQNREKSVASGREALLHELKRLGLSDAMPLEAVARLYNFDRVEELFEACAAAEPHPSQVANRIIEEQTKQQPPTLDEMDNAPRTGRRGAAVVVRPEAHGVQVLGSESSLLTTIATCCRPVFGDEIIGFVTRGRGIAVHRRDCKNITAAVEAERLIEITWGAPNETYRYSVPIAVVALDRVGLMNDVSAVLSKEGVNVNHVSVDAQHGIATFRMTLELCNMSHLTRVLNKIVNVPSVREAYRLTSQPR